MKNERAHPPIATGRSSGRTALSLGLLVLAFSFAAAADAVRPRVAGLESTPGFDQMKENPWEVSDPSTFVVVSGRAYEGRRSARARTAGDATTETKYARGIFNVKWSEGAEVWIGCAFYLPRGFLRAVQGHVTLMRWDNWHAYESGYTHGSFDRMGIMILASDRKARLIYMDDEFRKLTAPFTISEGRWHWLEVFQRFDHAHPQSEIWLDNTRVGRSGLPNYDYSHAFRIDRVRYGLVESWDSVQSKPLELWIDRAAVSTRRLGPLP